MRQFPTLKLSKTDAAKRQLETAVRLWFFSQDPVSVHTLTAAAHKVLYDVGKRRGVLITLRNPENIRPEYRRKYHELISRYENFFKHADKDADGLLDFNPDATEIYLFDAVLAYETLTCEITPILGAMKAWGFMRHPNLANEKDREKVALAVNQIDVATLCKADFFMQFQEGLLRSGIAI